MIITGIILGPYVLNMISPEILNISSELRRNAPILLGVSTLDAAIMGYG